MMYDVKAVDSSGSVVSLEVLASNEDELQSYLTSKTLTLVSFKNQNKISVKPKGRVTKKSLLQLTGKLSALLKAHLPLAKALVILKVQSETLALEELLSGLLRHIEGGKSLSEALEEYPNVFQPIYINMVKVGETGGFLAVAMMRLHENLEMDYNLKKKLKNAMIYPASMMTVMIASILILVTFVVPTFAGMFDGMEGELPLPTMVLMNASEFLQARWWVIGVLVFFMVMGFKKWVSKKEGRIQFHKILLQLPLVGSVIHQLLLSRFAQTMGTLLDSGVPLVQALSSSIEIVDNQYVQTLLSNAHKKVQQGESFSNALKDHVDVFSEMLIGMIYTGEETGQLGEMLNSASEFFRKESEEKINVMMTLMEPIIIVVMGGAVGFIIMAILLPVFNMSTGVH